MVALNLTMFIGVALLFGYTFTRGVLGQREAHVLVPLSLLIGLIAHNFFVNLFSYFMPIKTSVWLVLGLMLLAPILLLSKRIKWSVVTESKFEPRRLKILFSFAIVISILSGLVAIKSLGHDDFFMGHMPLASTITDGNFPVMDPSSPDRALSYHYAADLESANINLITGLPIWLAYDLQIFLFTGPFFLLLFALLYEITRAFGVSLAGAALFFYGHGLQWLYFFTKGLPALWRRFILHEQIPAFWKWVADIAFPKLNSSYIFVMNNHSVAIGVPALALGIYLLVLAFRTSEQGRSWTTVLAGGLLFGYSALAIETYFSIVTIALLIFCIWQFFRDGRQALFTLTFLVIALLVAYFQGGIFSHVLADPSRDALVPVSSFQEFRTLDLAPNPDKIDNSASYVYLLSPEFFIQFGLPLILILPALWYFLRKHSPLVFFVIAGLGAFAVPLLFRYPVRPWEISRFFALAIPIFSLAVGVWLMYRYDETLVRKMKIIFATLVVLVGASGLLSQTIFAVSSLDTFGQVRPLIKRPPEPSAQDALAIAWIREHTTISDRFFPYSEEFVRFTGRFTPGYYPYFSFSQHESEQKAYADMVERCSPEAFKFFKINYIYMFDNFPIKNPQTCLRSLDAKLVYGSRFSIPVIYKIPHSW